MPCSVIRIFGTWLCSLACNSLGASVPARGYSHLRVRRFYPQKTSYAGCPSHALQRKACIIAPLLALSVLYMPNPRASHCRSLYITLCFPRPAEHGNAYSDRATPVRPPWRHSSLSLTFTAYRCCCLTTGRRVVAPHNADRDAVAVSSYETGLCMALIRGSIFGTVKIELRSRLA